MTKDAATVLCIDDDRDSLRLIERVLSDKGIQAVMAEQASHALQLAVREAFDLILLDLRMPEMDGFEFCRRLQQLTSSRNVPVVFLTASSAETDRRRAFAAGAVDYIVKPFDHDDLVETVRKHLKQSRRWNSLSSGNRPDESSFSPVGFEAFKDLLRAQVNLPAALVGDIDHLTPATLYSSARALGITPAQMASYAANASGLSYIGAIDPERIKLGQLPIAFCKSHLVLPVASLSDQVVYVISNPFDLELLDILKRLDRTGGHPRLLVTEPENFETFFEPGMEKGQQAMRRPGEEKDFEPVTAEACEEEGTVNLSVSMLRQAVKERASDIHIAPKECFTVIRFRIDGDLREYRRVSREDGARVISRLKAHAGLDISERRRPQDGSLETHLGSRLFKLRLATSGTPYGESLVIRLLEANVRARRLPELGMNPAQAEAMSDFSRSSQGLLLFVGPTGSGKTTTIYSLVSEIDCRSRSLVTVEDPVEYHIPFANQQQVNEKAGVTFETLLRAAVRQDPDVLFLGEIRDSYSAKVAMDCASTGRLTLSTLHTSNATTAVYRLERLGIPRGAVADALLGIVAQRLVKRLCPHCKEVGPIQAHEIELLRGVGGSLPSRVARPGGCERCKHSGFFEREGIYEILRVNATIANMIRDGAPVSRIREVARRQGSFLMNDHLLSKVGDLLVSPAEAALVLTGIETVSPVEASPNVLAPPRGEENQRILLVEDDPDNQALTRRYLENDGYQVEVAQDGAEALMQIGKHSFDLILSDLRMPNLDGFKLMEIRNLKKIRTPIAFLTARSEKEVELESLRMGAADFIRKPIQEETFLRRVRECLSSVN